ncbi:hypothetical protein BDZ90DRAFT_96287 [Jaminaea rosea]|uniref:Uncharacterized protein n=1 Tax=Jaminaea rosea TaxID=1569628 RepID=A0A316UHT3_9BASI|nr:hypothetical protein BDZ90DRAFT_96287 [Jaminaea rosea]PWN24780.1 hypothetical protein BDZ90DRAFT_96287 [Jaminaea rosea]
MSAILQRPSDLTISNHLFEIPIARADDVIIGSCYGGRACTQHPRGPYGYPVRAPLSNFSPLTLPAGCLSFHPQSTAGLLSVTACGGADCKGECQKMTPDGEKEDDVCFTPERRDASVDLAAQPSHRRRRNACPYPTWPVVRGNVGLGQEPLHFPLGHRKYYAESTLAPMGNARVRKLTGCASARIQRRRHIIPLP